MELPENHKQNKFITFILGLRPVKFVINLSKKIVLPGFDGLPLFNVGTFFFWGIQQGSITTRASSMAFHFFLALFPAIIFFFTMIPYIPVDNFREQLMDLLSNVLPSNVYDASKGTIESIVNDRKGGLLSIGFLSMLYFSTNGINSMIRNFNQTHHAMETRGFFKQRMVSIALMLILSVLLLAAILLIILSKSILGYMVDQGMLDKEWVVYMVQGGKWVIMIALYFFAISFIYYLGPAKKSVWRFVSAGSSTATLFSIVVSLAFAFFVNNFGQYNKLYGSIGTIIVMMLWIYFNSVILLIGFELNASIKSAGKSADAATPVDSISD